MVDLPPIFDSEIERMAMARLAHALQPRPEVLARAASHLALGKEYLRRIALWATELGRTDLWPFFDVAQHAIPSLTEPAPQPECLRGQIGLVRDILAAWLRYLPLARSPALAMHGLPDPYLPLVRIFERGASFYKEERVLYCGYRGIHYGMRLPLPAAWMASELALNDAALDEIDAIDAAELAKR